jgi:hypothetical protein
MKKLNCFLLICTVTISLALTAVAQTPAISSFTPVSAKPGDVVTITGSGFNTTTSNNIVFFGATQATITAATATSLTATVPIGAAYAPITVLNATNALATYSSRFFNPTFSPNKGSIASTDITARVSFATGARPYSVAIGDIDGDGKADIVTANQTANTVSVLRNTGSGSSLSFATKVDFTTGPTPFSVALGDMDGDGKLDIAIVNRGDNTISVLRNTGSVGNLSFAAKTDFATSVLPWSIAIGDMDGDGRPDLAVANLGANSASILRNTSSVGSLSFDNKIDLTTGATPRAVAIGDIDGDGKAELVTANQGENSVSVFRNTGSAGTISFAAKTDFTTGQAPLSVAIGDLDGDGKLDVSAGNFTDNTVSVLRNTSSVGTLGFAAKTDFATGSAPSGVAFGDIDGDGKPELAITNQTAFTISLLRNTSSIGSLNLTPKVDLATGQNPFSLAIGDLNNDGKLDFATADYSDNTVSVLVNNPVFSTNANLSNLNLSDGTLSPNFLANTTSYTAAVNSSTNNITVTPTTAEQNATVELKINGGNYLSVTSGNASSNLALIEGNNIIIVKVTAQDGITFKEYTITVTKAATLPVSLISFDAKMNNSGSVDLTWSTASEINNSHYIILNSTDGVNFSRLAKISGSGNSNQQNRYQTSDINPANGNNYYQLVQYDTDGKATLLSTKVVNVSLISASEVSIYPIPFKNTINAKFESGLYNTIKLLDMKGSILVIKAIDNTQSQISLENLNLPAATYIIRLEGKAVSVSKTIVKN